MSRGGTDGGRLVRFRAAAYRLWRSPSSVFFLTVLLTYAYFPPSSGWNENSRFDLTRAIVEQGSLFIDSYHLNTGDKARCAKTHYCTDKAPGASLVGVVPYALFRAYLRWRGAPPPTSQTMFASAEREAHGQLGRADHVLVNGSFRLSLYVIVLFAAAIPGAAAGLLLVHLCRRLGQSARGSLAVGALYCLGTIAFPFSTTLFGHQLASCLFLGAVVLAHGQRELARQSGVPRPGPLCWAGALAGASCTAEYTMAVPGVLLAVFVLWSTRWRGLLWFGLGALVPLGGLMLYHWAAFGSPVAVGYGRIATPEFARGQSQGLYGVTLPRLEALWGTLGGRFRGLLYISPVLMLALWGGVRLWRGRVQRPLLVVAAVMVAYFLLLNASYYMWWGGASAGPRHVLPMVPFLCLGLVGLPWRGWLWKGAVGLLGAASVLNVLALTMAGVKAPEHGDLLLDYAWPTVLGLSDRVVQSTLGTRAGLPPLASGAVLVLFWLLATVVVTQRLRDQGEA